MNKRCIQFLTATSSTSRVSINIFMGFIIIGTSVSTRHSIQYRIKFTALLTLPVSLYISRGKHFSDLVSYVNLNQRSISFPTVYNMSMFDEINDFCHLSSDVIVRPKYAPDTLTKSSTHKFLAFYKKTKVDSIFRSEVVR